MTHGGVCIFVKECLISKALNICNSFSKEVDGEFAAIELIKENLVIICTYRSPSGSLENYFQILNDILRNISLEKKILVAGDFNLNFNISCFNTIACKNIFLSYNLKDIVQDNTRVTSVSQTRNDNVFSNFEAFDLSLSVYDPHLFHHCAVEMYIKLDISIKDEYIVCRPETEEKKSHFKISVGNLDWSPLNSLYNPNDMATLILNGLTGCNDTSFPELKIKKSSLFANKAKIPINTVLKKMKNQLDAMLTISLCTRNSDDRIAYKIYKKHYWNAVKNYKLKNNSDLIMNSNNKQKTALELIQTGKNKKKTLSDSVLTASTFSKYFIGTIDNLMENFND